MLKNIVKLEFQIENRMYEFLCDNDSPLGHIKEVLFQIQKYIGQVEDKAREQLAAQEAPKQEEPPSVEA